MTTSVFSDPDAASVARANVRAEMRAIEMGRRVRFDRERGCFAVLGSDGTTERHMVASIVSGRLVVLCDCPAGWDSERRMHRPSVPGRLPCWHAAKAARYLERMRLARFDGVRWVGTRKAEGLAA